LGKKIDNCIDRLLETKNWTTENFKDEVYNLLNTKFTIRHVDNAPFMLVYHIELSKMQKLSTNELLIFLVGQLPEDEKPLQYDYLNKIQTLVIQESLSMTPHLLIFLNTSKQIMSDFQSCLYNFNVIDIDTFKTILQVGSSTIIGLLQKIRPKNVVSPFKYLGPCAPDVFVGREEMISEIIDSDQAGYAITGGRRIGKTSLLLKIQYDINSGRQAVRYDNFLQRYEKQSYDCCYVDCINLYSFQDVYNEIFRKRAPKEIQKGRVFSSLTEMISRTSALQNKKLLLLLDEMDDLMEMVSVHDRDAENFQKDLQKAANRNMLKFVICGFRNISKVIRDPGHPFFNLCKGLYMTPLKKREIKKLLVMSNIQQLFKVPDHHLEKVVDRLNIASGGYPSVVQYIADQLMRTDRDGTVNPNTINQVVSSKETRAFVLETLIMNTNTFERLICILAVNISTITTETIINALIGKTVRMNDPDEEVMFALKNLCNNCILYDEGDKFSFLYPLIPEIIKKHLVITAPRLIKTLATNYNK